MLARVLAAIPLTALVAFVTQFTDLLRVPWLIHPDWAASVNESIRPAGVIAVLLTFLLFYPLKKRPLRWISMTLFIVTLVLLCVCYWYHGSIDNVATPAAIESAIRLWSHVYVAACVTLLAAATTIGLWFTARPT